MDGMSVLGILFIKSRDFVDGTLIFLNPSINYGFFMDGLLKMNCTRLTNSNSFRGSWRIFGTPASFRCMR